MKKYKGNNITATRYSYLLVGNDDLMTYQVIDSKNGEVLFENVDEEECLNLLYKLSGIKSYDEKVLSNL